MVYYASTSQHVAVDQLHGFFEGWLVRRLLERLGDIYMIDLMCDPGLLPFYEALGLLPMQGAGRRAYGRQADLRDALDPRSR